MTLDEFSILYLPAYRNIMDQRIHGNHDYVAFEAYVGLPSLVRKSPPGYSLPDHTVHLLKLLAGPHGKVIARIRRIKLGLGT